LEAGKGNKELTSAELLVDASILFESLIESDEDLPEGGLKLEGNPCGFPFFRSFPEKLSYIALSNKK